MKLIRELFKLKKLNKAIKDRIIGRYGQRYQKVMAYDKLDKFIKEIFD